MSEEEGGGVALVKDDGRVGARAMPDDAVVDGEFTELELLGGLGKAEGQQLHGFRRPKLDVVHWGGANGAWRGCIGRGRARTCMPG